MWAVQTNAQSIKNREEGFTSPTHFLPLSLWFHMINFSYYFWKGKMERYNMTEKRYHSFNTFLGVLRIKNHRGMGEHLWHCMKRGWVTEDASMCEQFATREVVSKPRQHEQKSGHWYTHHTSGKPIFWFQTSIFYLLPSNGVSNTSSLSFGH